MKKFKNVKSIMLDVAYEGQGCVNYDSAEQKDFIRFKTDLYKGTALQNSNVTLAKKEFYALATEDGKTKYSYKYKVSSDCLKSAIFKESIPFQNPSICLLDNVLYNAIAHPDMMSRGYMFTSQNGNTIRKKSSLTLTDAVEIGPERTALNLDFHCRSGKKATKEGENDASDNTIYNKETVGKLNYQSRGFIDLTELQFIPTDVIYDRMAADLSCKNTEKIYFDALRRNFVNFEPEVKPYYIPNSYAEENCSEHGIMLNQDSVDYLVKRIFKNILNMSILRRDAYFKTTGLKVSINTEDGTFSEDITLDNVDDFYFEYFQKYLEGNEDRYQKIMDDYRKAEKEKKEEAKNKKSKKAKKETNKKEEAGEEQ